MKLSLVERETILLYNQAEPMAEVYTHDPHLHHSQSSGTAGLPSCLGSYHRERDSRPCHFV